MFVMTEGEGIINLDHYNRVRIEGNSLVATKGKEKKYLVAFDNRDHAQEALNALFERIENEKPAWNGKLFKEILLNPDKYSPI